MSIVFHNHIGIVNTVIWVYYSNVYIDMAIMTYTQTSLHKNIVAS